MSITFPSSPTTGQTAAVNGRTYSWNGSAWDLVANVTGHAASHASGGADALSLSASQITSGTLDAARLPASAVLTTDTRLASDGNKGDITVSGSGAAWTINANAVVTADIADSAVTDAKIAAVAASKLTGTVANARLSSAVALHSAINAYNSGPSSGLDIYPRGEAANIAMAVNNGTVYFAFFTPTVTVTVSSITMFSGTTTAASGLTLARMGLYTFDETTATLVARTASDTTLFTAVSTAYQRSFATAGGFPATYQLTAGTRYGIAIIFTGTTTPQCVARTNSPAVHTQTPRTTGNLGSQSDLPATALASAFGIQQGMPFARLS